MTDITIVATTYLPPDRKQALRRMAAFEACLGSWWEHLKLDGGNIHLHVADDGTEPEMWAHLQRQIGLIWPERKGNLSFSQQQRHGYGASLNNGFKRIFENQTRIILHAVDDWELLSDLDLNPWVEMLNHSNVGMIRFFPHPGLTGTFEPTPQGWAVRLERHHFVFGLRPALFHWRMFEPQLTGYGWFKEDVSAIETEADFNQRVCMTRITSGPLIYLALPEQWRPLETGSMSELQPK